MKAEELMVGDWVMPLKKLKGIPGKVVTIEGGTDICWIDSKYYSCLFLCRDVEGIPITPEILEKNSDGGFCYHDCPIIGYNGKRSTYHIGRASLYVEWERISMKPYIEIHGLGDTFYKNYVACVHELQHALRLCGIEKEIML